MEQTLDEALAPPEDPAMVVVTCREIIDTLRDHIYREDTVLFPLAREVLGKKGMARLAERLEGV